MNNVAINQQTEGELTEELSPEDNAVSLGGLLSHAREALGVSLGRVADELKIPESKLKALELGEYHKLASPTFVKGYLRTYSRYLNLNVDDVIRRYDHICGGDAAAVVQDNKTVSRLEPIEKPFPELRWPLAIGAVILMLIAGYILWGDDLKQWLAGTSENTAPIASSVIEPSNVDSQLSVTDVVVESPLTDPSSVSTSSDTTLATSITDANPVETELVQIDNLLGSASGVTAQGESLSPDSVTASAFVEAPEVNVVSEDADINPQNTSISDNSSSPILNSQDTLTFTFDGDCWLEVRDADDSLLYSGVEKLGQSLTLTGRSPFSIRFGNARVVSLLHNGETVAINPIAGRNTLRLQVGQ